MASRRANARITQLWQLPLLLVSLGLFGYAGWRFIDPQPGLTIDQKIGAAREFLAHGRPTAAIGQLNQILSTEKLVRENEAKVHLLLAESIEAAQKQQKLDLPPNHERIIEQSRLALSQGVKPGAEIYRRMGDSYAALAKPAEALENYRRAIALDAGRALSLQRKVIDLQLVQSDLGPAEASLDEYLKDGRLADGERAWALGKKAQLLVDRRDFIAARALLGEALRSDADPMAQGQYEYGLGYCAWKLGDTAEAERHLRVARDLLKVSHPLDADAAYALGRILQDKGQHEEAVSFYQAILVSHPGADAAPLARLGRGVCRVAAGQDEAGLSDLEEIVAEIGRKRARRRFKPDVIAGLRTAAADLTARGNYDGALELMAHEQALEPKLAADFFKRLAGVYEQRSSQVEQTVAAAKTAADKIRREQQVRELRTKAGDAWIAYSRAVTVVNDKAHGEATWRGVDLYDRAGNMPSAIAALELFAAEHPDDGLAPDALLRLGNAYQAAGLFDKAVAAYQRNQARYPNSLAASKSGVPLARAFIARGPGSYPSAERTLLRVITDNPVLDPSAEEFREALFELAQLYYRTNRYEESIARLEEMVERYPTDERKGQLLFLMADGYRKSASLLKAISPAASASVSADPKAGAGDAAALAEAALAKKERLGKARTLYESVIAQYRDVPPARDLDRLYLKLSHFYRADCLYDLGQYEQAIRLYDAAALKYQDDPSALAAYVQIVNAYCALGKVQQAKTANERAKWLLKKIPPESFENGQFSMPKEYWEQWLKWTNEAGLW